MLLEISACEDLLAELTKANNNMISNLCVIGQSFRLSIELIKSEDGTLLSNQTTSDNHRHVTLMSSSFQPPLPSLYAHPCSVHPNLTLASA